MNARILLCDGREIIECPHCGMRSDHPMDVGKRYCAVCRIFFDTVEFPDGHVENQRELLLGPGAAVGAGQP